MLFQLTLLLLIPCTLLASEFHAIEIASGTARAYNLSSRQNWAGFAFNHAIVEFSNEGTILSCAHPSIPMDCSFHKGIDGRCTVCVASFARAESGVRVYAIYVAMEKGSYKLIDIIDGAPLGLTSGGVIIDMGEDLNVYARDGDRLVKIWARRFVSFKRDEGVDAKKLSLLYQGGPKKLDGPISSKNPRNNPTGQPVAGPMPAIKKE